MKRNYNAPKWFVKTYNEITDQQKKADKFLTDKTGYSPEWCKQNLKKVFELLSKDERKEMDILVLKGEAIKRYLWSRYYYQNWSKVKDVISSPFGKADYNEKKETITISDASGLKKKLHKIGEELKKFVMPEMEKKK